MPLVKYLQCFLNLLQHPIITDDYMNFENVHVVSYVTNEKNIPICQISITASCFSDKILLPIFKNSFGHLLFWSEKLVSKWAKMSFFDVSRILIRKATNYSICILLQTLTFIWSDNNCFRKISWNLKTTAVWKCPQCLQVAKILNIIFRHLFCIIWVTYFYLKLAG